MDAGWMAQPGGGRRAVHPAGAPEKLLRGFPGALGCLCAIVSFLHPLEACAQATPSWAARSIALPSGTLAVKVENGFAVAQDGARSFRLYALAKQPPEERTIAFDPKQLGVFSFSVEDFSISPDGVLYVAAYVNFGLGDSRYALLRYALLEMGAEPQVRHLPDVRCRFLGAGVHGVWCLDPEPREMRAEPPTLTWIAFLGAVRRYTVLREPGISLGPPRVVVAGDDVAETWLPSMRAFLEAHPMDGVRTQAPIPVDPSSRALTSFAVSPGGRIQALAPLRENGVEMLTTPYALVELNAQRNAWRRMLPGRRFARGSLLAGWSATELWLWNRATHSLETIAGVEP
jgi:hypothetical protein